MLEALDRAKEASRSAHVGSATASSAAGAATDAGARGAGTGGTGHFLLPTIGSPVVPNE
jgi:hypothetical protein